jgi:hypothetical protein
MFLPPPCSNLNPCLFSSAQLLLLLLLLLLLHALTSRASTSDQHTRHLHTQLCIQQQLAVGVQPKPHP